VRLTTLSIFHLTVAYTLLTNPHALATQNMVVVLGAALQLPRVSASLDPAIGHPAAVSFTTPGNPALGLAALFLSFLALSDFTALSMHEEVHNLYWAAQVSVRLAAMFVFEAWLYLTKPVPGEVAEGRFKGLKNDVVFTWAFVEMFIMFWVFTVLRAERKEIGDKRARALEREKD